MGYDKPPKRLKGLWKFVLVWLPWLLFVLGFVLVSCVCDDVVASKVEAVYLSFLEDLVAIVKAVEF